MITLDNHCVAKQLCKTKSFNEDSNGLDTVSKSHTL